MPIKPENRDRYPKDWPEISWRIRERAGQRCEFCGVRNHELGGRLKDGSWLPARPLGEKLLRLEWPKPGTWSWCGPDGEKARQLRIIHIVLTVAHMDHDPENCAAENLKALCQRCHLRYDAAHHASNARQTIRARKASGDLFA